MTENTACSVDGCNSEAVTRGWCKIHYGRWLRNGSPTSGRVPPGTWENQTCAVIECDQPVKARGWCMAHYRRWKAHGDPLLGRFAVPFHERATVCTVESCDDPVRTRGWCRRHYQIWLRTGDPLTPPKYTRRGASIQERIEASVVKTDTCWFWIKHTNHDGYGVIGVGGRLMMAHRVSYEAFVGPIPEGLVIDHVCRNRACVRPDPAHLEPVTHLENVRRGDSMKRASHCCHGHEFTPDNTSWKQCCRTCERASRERSKKKRQQQ